MWGGGRAALPISSCLDGQPLELAISGARKMLSAWLPYQVPLVPAHVSSEIDRHWPPVRHPSSLSSCQCPPSLASWPRIPGSGCHLLAFRGFGQVRYQEEMKTEDECSFSSPCLCTRALTQGWPWHVFSEPNRTGHLLICMIGQVQSCYLCLGSTQCCGLESPSSGTRARSGTGLESLLFSGFWQDSPLVPTDLGVHLLPAPEPPALLL